MVTKFNIPPEAFEFDPEFGEYENGWGGEYENPQYENAQYENPQYENSWGEYEGDFGEYEGAARRCVRRISAARCSSPEPRKGICHPTSSGRAAAAC